MASIPVEDQASIMEETIFADYKTTFDAVMEVFFERGYLIKKASKSSGIIDTNYLSESHHWWFPLVLYSFRDRRTKVYAYIRKLDEKATKVKLRLIVEDKFWGPWKRNDVWVKPEDYQKYFRLIGEKVIEEDTPRIPPSQSQYEELPYDPVRSWKLTPLEDEEDEDQGNDGDNQ
jgi:hypothetical protein